MDFDYTPKVKALAARLNAFMDEHVYPNEARYYGEAPDVDRWQPSAVIEALKPKAQAAGLWNLFLPASERGAGLANLEYAPLCEIMGRVLFAPEIFNRSAPDTGNMEVLERYGTPAQKKRWRESPLDPKTLGAGRGFVIAQGRLRPGRIHHCTRLIGLAERALEKLCRRVKARVTFGKPVADRTMALERIAEARILIDQARLLTL